MRPTSTKMPMGSPVARARRRDRSFDEESPFGVATGVWLETVGTSLRKILFDENTKVVGH